MSESGTRFPAPGWRQRLAAWLALATAVCVVVFLGVEAVRRWDVLLVTVASLSVLVGSAWVALSRRGARRTAALASGAAALAVFAVVVIASESLRVLLVALGLAVLTVASARVALDQGADDPDPLPPGPPKPSHPVLIMNLKSGGGKAERFKLVDQCHERGIEPVVLTPGADLLQLAEDAVARGADVIGMAGGDGSQALVASVASRAGVPFVVVPAGTRNHFALDLGLDREDVLGSLDAFADGVDRTIDLAEVNGRVFVNNASMGVYAKIVQSQDYRDAKVQTTAAKLPELLGPDATPLDLRFTLPGGDEATTAQLLLVSNNPYQLDGLRGAGTRTRLDGGELGVVSLRVGGVPDANKLAALEAVGQLSHFSGFNQWAAAELEVRSGSPVEIGVDGEAMSLEPPLRFVIRPGALTVRLTRSVAERSAPRAPVRISSRDTFAALWRTARGLPVERL